MKTIVFDVGGVLIDWDPDYLYRKLIPDTQERAHFFEHVCPRGWNARADAGLPWADAVAERIAMFPDYADLIRAFDERWPEMVAGPIHDVVALKSQLRGRGVPVYAITNYSSEKWRLSQKLWPMLAEFDGVVVSGDEKIIKPDPRIYQILFDRYNLKPADCLFIDDLAQNIEAAKAAGMSGHVFTKAAHLRQALDEFLGS